MIRMRMVRCTRHSSSLLLYSNHTMPVLPTLDTWLLASRVRLKGLAQVTHVSIRHTLMGRLMEARTGVK